MDTPYIIFESICAQICKLDYITHIEEVIHEFIQNYIGDHTETRTLLCNLSNLYVMVAKYNTESRLKPGEYSWKDCMTDEQYSFLSKNGHMIIGVIHYNKSSYNDVDLIDWIDSRVPRMRIARNMIEKYETKNTNKMLIPREIIQSSALYWYKELGITIDDLKDDYPLLIEKDHLDWSKLDGINPE